MEDHILRRHNVYCDQISVAIRGVALRLPNIVLISGDREVV